MKLGTEVGLGPGHIMSDGDPASPPKMGTAPQFSTHVHCDKKRGTPPLFGTSAVAKQLDESRCYLVRRQAMAEATLC